MYFIRNNTRFASAHIIPGCLMLLIIAARCNSAFAVALVTLSMGFNGASTLTNLQNCQDLGPNFAGTLYGLINVVATTSGPVIPMMISAITAEKVNTQYPMDSRNKCIIISE